MILVSREFLQYEEDFIKYYINIPKLYYKEKDDKDYIENEMIAKINKIIFEDILIFMDIVEDSYNLLNKERIFIDSLTEFQIGYKSNDIISLAIEFSQLSGFSDISYLKGYNYDFNLEREIHLKDLFKDDSDFLNILKKYIFIQVKKIFIEFGVYKEELDYFEEDNINLDEDNTFYFTNEFLVLPFSSCEIHKEILNLLEIKIPFNKIYYYLSEYTIKNIVKKIIL